MLLRPRPNWARHRHKSWCARPTSRPPPPSATNPKRTGPAPRNSAPRGSLSQADYDAAESTLAQAQAGVAQSNAAIVQAQATVASADAALKRSQQNLVYCTIKSPVKGVIIDRRVNVGQTVVSSLNAPSLFLIAKDLSRMQVLVQVNEADVGHVKPGDPVTFTSDTFPGELFKGQVRKVRLNATMTQNVVTYTVEIVTDNSSMTLLPYLTANVRFVIDQRKNAMAVPNPALRWAPAGAPIAAVGGGKGDVDGTGAKKKPKATVWVLRNEQLVPIAVRPGLSDGTLTEVTGEDLAEGDQVVIGEISAAAAAAASTNPFAPQIFRGGGRPAGGGGGR